MTTPTTLFRRGDLAVLEIQHSYDSVTDGRTVYTVYEFHRVAGVDRTGQATKFSDYTGCTVLRHQVRGLMRVLVLPQDRVDVDAALGAAWTEHTHGPTSNVPAPFDSLDETREFLRPYRKP